MTTPHEANQLLRDFANRAQQAADFELAAAEGATLTAETFRDLRPEFEKNASAEHLALLEKLESLASAANRAHLQAASAESALAAAICQVADDDLEKL